MTRTLRQNGDAPVVTFHARVASVGLVTTVAALLAACLVFMMQQWVVARAEAHRVHIALVEVAAHAALTAGNADYGRRLAALGADPDVRSVVVTNARGAVIATYTRKVPGADKFERIDRPLVIGGQRLGDIAVSMDMPRLSPMLPKFFALIFVLLFGGVGMALFLSRSLAHRVIAPVQRLSEAMHDVAEGGGFRTVEADADDELFRSLTHSFNHLQAKLAEREHDLVQARDAANTANVLKTQFLANMSHEIRTPLNGVLAMAEVMAMGELGDVQRERLQIIRQSGGLLLAVLNDVLDLSKIEAGKLSLMVEPFELEPVLAPVVESFSVMARGKGLAFEAAVDPAAQGWWRGDPDRLRQVVGNLLSNAVKFTPYGSVWLAIDVNPQSGALRVSVRDTGIGIAPEKLPTLFEKFTQADNSATRRFGGTGLGLAICRELTQMMGGAIDVESGEGEGSTFLVELPLARGEPVSEPAPEPARADEGALRLLAAEDNATNQQVLAAVMESLGIRIDIVADGRQAVEAWSTAHYDLILMDIQMPVMDGIAAAREIREMELAQGRPRTPIIALTANALTHQVAEYLAAGMDGHVPKPIEIAKLYEAISAALNAAATGGDGVSVAAA